METLKDLLRAYEDFKSKGASLDMTRGKPAPEQLDTMERLLTAVTENSECFSGKTDCRNYGVVDGIPEAKRLFSEILRINEENIIVGGNSSLNLMYDAVALFLLLGVGNGCSPWCRYDKISFLCPSPGYDRHFRICAHFGINLIYVPMLSDGPDMDAVEKYVSEDETIKGIWCIPKYSNPTGVTFSDETVRRFANLKPKAKDFRVFWDNAYAVHDLTDTPDVLLNVYDEAVKCGNEDMFYIFTSTSKISYSGAGIAAVASSKANIAYLKKAMSVQTIGHDKINQLRHVKVFPNLEAVKKQMEIHRSLLLPKFKVALKGFEKELSAIDGVSWTKPNGGYFISLTVPEGCAKRVVALAKDAGLVLTPAGSGFPYDIDPRDENIRIAPSYPSEKDLVSAIELLCICIKIAVYESR